MNKYIFAFLFIISSFVCAAAYSKDLTGSYRCNGTEVNSKNSFLCIMQVKKTNQTYAVEATCNDHTSYSGTAIFNKSKHVLSIVFVNPENIKETGIIVSNVAKNGLLNSTWTYLHNTTVARGFCVKKGI